MATERYKKFISGAFINEPNRRELLCGMIEINNTAIRDYQRQNKIIADVISSLPDRATDGSATVFHLDANGLFFYREKMETKGEEPSADGEPVSLSAQSISADLLSGVCLLPKESRSVHFKFDRPLRSHVGLALQWEGALRATITNMSATHKLTVTSGGLLVFEDQIEEFQKESESKAMEPTQATNKKRKAEPEELPPADGKRLHRGDDGHE